MATNPFFNNFYDQNEQNLVEELLIESIKIFGLDFYYVPRRIRAEDKVLGSDAMSYFDKAYLIEMYVKSVDGFEGQGSFFSKIAGVEIRDQITLSASRSRFMLEIGNYEGDNRRPKEGDLVYFPLNDKCFEIKYVDDKNFFYQMGALPLIEMTCELFEYSSEAFSTGIPAIDRLQQEHSLDAYDWALVDPFGRVLVDQNDDVLTDVGIDRSDLLTDNDRIQIEADEVVVWDEKDPFTDNGRY